MSDLTLELRDSMANSSNVQVFSRKLKFGDFIRENHVFDFLRKNKPAAERCPSFRYRVRFVVSGRYEELGKINPDVDRQVQRAPESGIQFQEKEFIGSGIPTVAGFQRYSNMDTPSRRGN